MKAGVAALPELLVGVMGDMVEGSIDSFRLAAGDFREVFFAEGFAEIPAAVIGIRDGGARVEVKVNGDGGCSWSIMSGLGFWESVVPAAGVGLFR